MRSHGYRDESISSTDVWLCSHGYRDRASLVQMCGCPAMAYGTKKTVFTVSVICFLFLFLFFLFFLFFFKLWRLVNDDMWSDYSKKDGI